MQAEAVQRLQAEEAERAAARAAAADDARRADQRTVGPGVAEPAKMKVTELRAALAERGLSTDGLKAVLVDRLQSALDDEAAIKRQRLERLKACGGVMRLPDELLGAVGVFADARPAVRTNIPSGIAEGSYVQPQLYVTNYCRGLVCASRRTLRATERAWEVLARRRYPKWAVDRCRDLMGSEEGYSCWRAVLAHDAAKFGMWCLDVSGASRRNTPGAWAEARIQRVAIDGLADGELVAVVEGYGDNLSDALGSALHADGTRILHVNTTTGAKSEDSKNKFKCIVRSRGHQICRMTFASRASALRAKRTLRDAPPPPPHLPDCYGHSGWDTSNTLAFQWPGYGISAPFLRKDPGQTWDAAFRGPGPLPEGASRRRFVPRPLKFPKEERTPRAEWVGD